MKPLSRIQKSALAALAREAYAHARVVYPDLDTWRRDQVYQACRRPGLRAATNDDYNAIRAHFLDLLGRSDQAFSALIATTKTRAASSSTSSSRR